MGRPPILDQNLVIKIAHKLGKTNLQIGKSVSAMAMRKGISSEVALVLFARKHNISAGTAQRKLSQDKQAEIRSIISAINVPVMPIKQKSKSIKSKAFNSRDGFFDPYLSVSTYANLNDISREAYSILFILENSLRSFISKVLFEQYGESWWLEIEKKKALLDIIKKVSNRKSNESENWYHTKRGAHEIYYTDYSELLEIIKKFESEFLKYFKKGVEKNLLGKLYELVPTRNIVAHNNPITRDDFDRLKIHAKDWIKYMQYLFGNKK